MANYSDLPKEIVLMILEYLNDLPSLLSIVRGSAIAYRLYEGRALCLVERVVNNHPTEIASLMRDTFAAHCSDRAITCTYNVTKDRIQAWKVPKKADIWMRLETWHTAPRKVLRCMANIEYDVASLLNWCTTERHLLYSAPGSSLEYLPVSEEVHRMLWELRMYVARMTNLNIGQPAQSLSDPFSDTERESAMAKRGRLRALSFIKHCWIAGLRKEDLTLMTTVLRTLEAGYGTLVRHQLLPMKGAMLRILFVRLDEYTQCWTKHLAISVHSHVFLEALRISYAMIEEALCKRSRGGNGDESEFGRLNAEDIATFDRIGSVSERRRRYLGHFKSLMGLSSESKTAVHELVRRRPRTLRQQPNHRLAPQYDSSSLGNYLHRLGVMNHEAGRLVDDAVTWSQ